LLWGLLSSPRIAVILDRDFPAFTLQVLTGMMQFGGFSERSQVARAVYQKLFHEASAKELVRLGMIPSLVKLLRSKNERDEELSKLLGRPAVQPELESEAMAEGALALQALMAADATARSIAFSAGALEALVGLLQDGEVVGRRNAAKALAFLSVGSTEIQTAIVRAGVVDMLVALHQGGFQSGDKETTDSAAQALLVLGYGSVQTMKAFHGHEDTAVASTQVDALEEPSYPGTAQGSDEVSR
jgi:hypothetical protein